MAEMNMKVSILEQDTISDGFKEGCIAIDLLQIIGNSEKLLA
jgi:hypothetical protein